MRFVIVRSDVAGCEPNCPQWISAEGAITAQTPALLKKILKQSGKNRLPILLSSPGGDLDAAMALGKLIRAKGLDVGVGWTSFADCWPDDATCKLPAEQHGVYRGSPVTWRAYCIATCPFMLAGGRKRLAFGTLIGVSPFTMTVTSQKLFQEERYRVVNGKKQVISRRVVKRGPVETHITTKLDKPVQRKLDAYRGAMGLAKGFLALYGRTTPKSFYYVTVKESLAAKLITGMESARSLVDAHLCQTMPLADNCISQVAAVERKPVP